MSLRTLLIVALVAASIGSVAFAEKASPPAKTDCSFASGATVSIAYSSPRMKGRKIFGGLVPYGQVWRTGANEATTFVTSVPVTLAGKEIPKGSYTLFTLPTADKWTLIISKKTGEWGIPYPGEKDDLVRVDLSVSKLPAPAENFTIGFEKGASCALHLDWDTTRASIDVVEKK